MKKKLAIENGDLYGIYPLKMVIVFRSYVRLQEGTLI